CFSLCFFFFHVTAPSDIYTLSLHDALPIFHRGRCRIYGQLVITNFLPPFPRWSLRPAASNHSSIAHLANQPCANSCVRQFGRSRSEEHTSELQSRGHLVCRLLLEKKNEKY